MDFKKTRHENDSLGGILTGLWPGNLRNHSLVPGRGQRFFLLHSLQTDSGVHPSPC
jgi:hypothetical protein